MKILLVGPYPPPHGGVSVHVYEIRRQLQSLGVECRVVNVAPRAPKSTEFVSIRSGWDLFRTLLDFASKGWTLHVHTNGHNRNSWLVALTAGLAALRGSGSILTLHSGMLPAYLAPTRKGARLMARIVCSLYQCVIAVAPEIKAALLSLGVTASQVEVLPAFLFTSHSPTEARQVRVLAGRKPLLASTLFFRPEYGFELLVEAVDRLRVAHPGIACVVMGSGERRKEAERLLKERGLEDFIYLLGNIPHQECISVISRCDLFVRPALADGDATSVREALSQGVPVVASDVGNRPQGVVLFRTGDLKDLVSKIDAAWSRPHLLPEGDLRATFEGLIEVYRSVDRACATGRRKEQWVNWPA